MHNPSSSIWICDTTAEAKAIAATFGVAAYDRGNIPVGALSNKSVVLLSAADAFDKAEALIEGGADEFSVFHVDLRDMQANDAIEALCDREALEALVARPRHRYWDTVRYIDQWGEDPPLDLLETGNTALAKNLKWCFPGLCVVVGGYGSGKSLLTQILIAQTVMTPAGRAQNLRMSVCAWEDRRVDYRARIVTHATGGFAGREADADYVIKHTKWFEPYAVDDRGIKQYIERVRYLAKTFGIRIHVFDPWNSHDFEMGVGEKENQYIRRAMTLLRALAQELGLLIVVVTHLPKSAFAEAGKIRPFRVGHASGSMDFGTRADIGLCVARSSYLSAVLDGETKDLEISDVDITVARSKGIFRSGDHMILSVDKLKIEGQDAMGQRGVYAFNVDKSTNQLVIDSPATHILRKLWRI